jgi:trehalose 6-phosphate phosphatase
VTAICGHAPKGTIEILPGKAVIEVKPARVSKATAVRELMKYHPFRDRHPIFIGDDVTDEPVFGVIPAFGGLGFSVGRVVPGVDGHFDRPEDVRAWLARLVADRGAAAE